MLKKWGFKTRRLNEFSKYSQMASP